MLYVVGDTMRYAFPESDFGDMAGRDLTQLTYVFTLAKWIDGFVVEGPVTLANGEESFVFLEPVDVDGAYHGEVAVALKADYVIEQLGLSQLEQDGYLYELWAVSPQDGRKDVIAVSDGGRDFSHAAKASFDMPTEWTLSIMPADGWVPGPWTAVIVAVATAIALLLVGCLFMGMRARRASRRIDQARRIDQETGMYNFGGFVEVLGKERLGSDSPLTLICVTVDDFEETSFAMGWDARQGYLGKVLEEIGAAVHGDQVSARVGCGTFVVAIHGRVGKHVLAEPDALARARPHVEGARRRPQGVLPCPLGGRVLSGGRRRPRGALGADDRAARSRQAGGVRLQSQAPGLVREAAPAERRGPLDALASSRFALHDALGHHGVGDLLEAGDVRAHDVSCPRGRIPWPRRRLLW